MNIRFTTLTRKQLTIAVCVAVLLLASLVTPLVVKASTARPNRTMQIKSVQIQDGDSLWSIAKDYYTDDYASMNDYITAIKQCNKITSDKIHTGNYIIVPYYAE